MLTKSVIFSLSRVTNIQSLWALKSHYRPILISTVVDAVQTAGIAYRYTHTHVDIGQKKNGRALPTEEKKHNHNTKIPSEVHFCGLRHIFPLL